ncbi:MAG: hypothetical protein HMLKMBBP_03262 [Planctomycetes bacterium]|nr:hypothetical protein [Planctomycetota bacterium]
MIRGASLAALLAVIAGPHAPAAAKDEPPRRLPFQDQVPPPPPLPEPLDRAFAGELASFDGDRVTLRWAWKSAAELDDFEPFVPVRATVSGGFTWKEEGVVEARGTGGIRLRLGMLSDLAVTSDAKLIDPHDLGVVMCVPHSSDESILCLLQDRHFTRFDPDAGNSTMINKLGGIPPTAPGVTEFRYVARSAQPKLEKGHVVRLDVVRSAALTTFTVTPKGEKPVKLQGKDTDTPYAKFQAGLYVAGAAADFRETTISGKIDREWCAENAILPFVAKDLLHPGNRFAGAERKAAEAVEKFLRQDPATTPEKDLVPAASLAAMVGDVKLPLVIRIRAAEAIAESGEGSVSERVAKLLDAPDLEARVLAWKVLRPRVPWHFDYDPEAEPKVRREAAFLVGAYLREKDDAEAQGKVFVEGYWYTQARADQIRANWEKSWDLTDGKVRLRTNLPGEWAQWYLAAMGRAYAEMTKVVGREPPKEALPLSVLVFATKDEFETFCNANGYGAKAAWKRFADLDRNVAFDTFERDGAPMSSIGLLAKLYSRAVGGTPWPEWFTEGRASWFGNPEYRTGSWDGETLVVGQNGSGTTVGMLRASAHNGKLTPLAEFLAQDPRQLSGEGRRLWYVHAWALHAYLMQAPDEDRKRFAEWQSQIETLKPSPREVEGRGRHLFQLLWMKDWDAFEARFREWVKGL